jgi:spermidine synthase
VIAGNLLVAVAAWWQTAKPPFAWRGIAACLALGAAAMGWASMTSVTFMKSPVREPRSLISYREGNNATVTVVEEASGLRTIMVDGQPVAGTATSSVIDQKMLAHLPLLLHPAPRRALTVGFGSGGTSYSMSLHDIDVDCVEIENAVPAAAEFFQSENHDILRHPRFRLILDDARSWLRVAPVRYDVIVTDCTNIQYRSNGDLYTVDYFRLLKDRLAVGGIAGAWVPANGITDRDLKTLLRSFHQAFPHTSIWYMNSLATDFLIVLGTPEKLDVDLEDLSRRMVVPEVFHDLQAAGLADPCRLLYTFLMTEQDLERYLGAGPLNVDDRPILSYSTYGSSFRATIAANLVQLQACRGDVAAYVRHAASTETMLRHYAASNEANLGHIATLVGAHDAAAKHYQRTQQLLPNAYR